ncbi:hypothetical protein N0V94_001390 [Neodidymelliopsis sp. IMI 364377]|nr:hypothetical protein N0V94_001390 [Neodidymelliopsis sp. IMI 364377]
MATDGGEDSVVLTRDDRESFNLLQSNTYDKLCTLNPPSQDSMEKLENYVADVVEMLAHYSGPLKDKAMRLITMVIGLVWDAVGRLISLHQNLSTLHTRGNRNRICQMLAVYLNSKLNMGHAFGRSFAKAKSEYVVALQNDEEAQRERNQSAILANKGTGFFKANIDRNFVKPAADRRDTAFGLDIRDAAGASLGDRQPMAGKSKNETLPIAGLVIMLQDQPNAEGFFDRWEEVTGNSIDGVLAKNVNIRKYNGNFPATGHYLPATFFARSSSERGLLVLSTLNGVLTAKLMARHVDAVKRRSPARPGDMLWLLDRFLTGMYPQGGEVDLCPGSLHLLSVYNKIRYFCDERTYQDHPHWRTLVALVDLTEKGLYEGHIPANYLLLGIEVLRQPIANEAVVRTGTNNRQRYEIDRPVLRIGTTRPAGIVAASLICHG